jgi:hypothetical protein
MPHHCQTLISSPPAFSGAAFLTNGFTKQGLISKKVPAPIVRIARASIAMIWETSHEEVVDTIFVGKDWQYDRQSPHMCSRHSRQPYRLHAGVRPTLIAYRGRFDEFRRHQGLDVEDVPGAVRQQQILRKRQRGRSSSRCPLLRRSDRCPLAYRGRCGRNKNGLTASTSRAGPFVSISNVAALRGMLDEKMTGQERSA